MRSHTRCMQAQCHAHLMQCEQELQTTLEATLEDPVFGQAWRSLGNARFHQEMLGLDQFDEAVTAYEKALELGLNAEAKQETQKHLKLAQARAAKTAEALRKDAAAKPTDGGEAKFTALAPPATDDPAV